MTFSVVTVCYNAVDTIESTINSVLCQLYCGFEYIVIDGKSTDGTLELIKQYSERIKWVSEKDSGIYDAMNKGISLATGDYLIFMNAGDVFYDSYVLGKITSRIALSSHVDVLYGNAMLISVDKTKLYTPAPLHKLRKGMITSHQSTFVKTDVLKQMLFDTRYRYAADYNQISALYLSGFSFIYTDVTIAKVRVDVGCTYSNFVKSKKEVFEIQKQRGQKDAGIIYLYEVTRFYMVIIYKKIKGLFK